MFRTTFRSISACRTLTRHHRGYANSMAQIVSSETHGHLPTSHSPITPTLHFFNSVTPDGEQIPTYRVLDGTGEPLEGAEVPEIDKDLARRMYEQMSQLPIIDNLLYNVQRQGKISFYMTAVCQSQTFLFLLHRIDSVLLVW
ncbi:hypothetical protein QCA50_006912 [Cerrena zonata]|uniref:2-oxoisovalerate dehydrogenase subunit alpha n=1 Tax=Cerrena zonata TaxID=2478898 RepID=A0AAW0GF53_9APHY